MKTPVSKRALKDHLAYHWWQYLLIVVISAFGWNLFYTMTAYQPPNEKIADLYSECFIEGSQVAADEWLAEVNRTQMPDMEQMRSVYITNDPTYGAMQLSVFMATNVPAVYILSGDSFQRNAANGYLIPLDNSEIMMQAINDTGINVEKGWRTETINYERHLFGIPLTELTGLEALDISCRDGYLCIGIQTGNEANLLHLAEIIVREMSEVKVSN